MTKVLRSEMLNSPFSWGMSCIIKKIKEEPGKAFRLLDFCDNGLLCRNDMINVRRQLSKIDNAKGPIRFLKPNNTHIVFIEDSVKTEKNILALLAVASAKVNLMANNTKLSNEVDAKLSNSMFEIITNTQRL